MLRHFKSFALCSAAHADIKQSNIREDFQGIQQIYKLYKTGRYSNTCMHRALKALVSYYMLTLCSMRTN